MDENDGESMESDEMVIQVYRYFTSALAEASETLLPRKEKEER